MLRIGGEIGLAFVKLEASHDLVFACIVASPWTIPDKLPANTTIPIFDILKDA
jgi:hypothetical protein